MHVSLSRPWPPDTREGRAGPHAPTRAAPGPLVSRNVVFVCSASWEDSHVQGFTSVYMHIYTSKIQIIFEITSKTVSKHKNFADVCSQNAKTYIH